MRNLIENIYIACYKGDFWQTKICVASIRKWYPDIKITLIKDILKGEFNTKDLEKKFNVSVSDFPFKKFGWGMSKLEPYFIDKKERSLILDSDIIFLGKVIDYLNAFDKDVVVSVDQIADYKLDWFKRTYYDVDKINDRIDSNFKYPGYTFNTGQLVVSSNLFKREDFNEMIEWTEPPKLKHRDMFIGGDQGVLNYMFQREEALENLSVGKADFKVWGNSPLVDEFDLEVIRNGQGYPKLIHWAGGGKDLRTMKRNDLIYYYQKLYFQELIFGEIKRRLFNFKQLSLEYLKLINRKFKIKRSIKSIFK